MSLRFALLPKNRPEGDKSLDSLERDFEKTMRTYLDHKDAEEELGLGLVEAGKDGEERTGEGNA